MTNYLNQFMSPDSSQMFAWYCIYGDEENSEDKEELYGPFSLVEIQNDGKEHEFSEIEKEKLTEFGLVGNGSRIYFNTKTGVFNIGEKYLFSFYMNPGVEKESVIKLNNDESMNYKDIIQYKQGACDFVFGKNGTQTSTLKAIGHFIGFKNKTVSKSGINFHYNIILEIPTDGRQMVFHVSITPSEDFTGSVGVACVHPEESDHVYFTDKEIKLEKNIKTTFDFKI